MTVQVVAITSIHPNSKSAIDKYLSVVGPLMKAAGAKVIRRFEIRDSIAGDSEIQYVSVIEYPNDASVKMVFDSDDYKSLDEVKKQAFSIYQVSTAVTL